MTSFSESIPLSHNNSTNLLSESLFPGSPWRSRFRRCGHWTRLQSTDAVVGMPMRRLKGLRLKLLLLHDIGPAVLAVVLVQFQFLVDLLELFDQFSRYAFLFEGGKLLFDPS